MGGRSVTYGRFWPSGYPHQTASNPPATITRMMSGNIGQSGYLSTISDGITRPANGP